MAITIRDVAKAAGVSAMAVSKVLHGKGANVRVGPDTAETIRRVAKELRYQPNRLARSFRQQKTNTIGLVFSRFGRIGDLDGYFAAFLNGVMSATFQSEYGLTICPKLSRSSSTGVVNDGRFDGILWCKPDYTVQTAESIQRCDLPIVMMHAPGGQGPDVPKFCCDNELGLKLAVDHLVELGHRRIAFVMDAPNRSTAEGRARIAGYYAAMESHGLATPDCNVLFWSIEQPELARFRECDACPTALIVFSERQSVAILKEAESIGISVPGDLSVVGFDSTAFCDTTRPRLTAIRQPIEQMAFDATNVLISSIEGQNCPSNSYLYPCGFDIRESTAIPASRC
ncbi:MAG: LacI family DNA-binding transcriptional regulator [Fimbriimonas sp.]|nr:LacI family DNA-binding transcriptional regulator [Fimbriimonas sp.]